MTATLGRRAAAEFLGTAGLLAAVIGSGIMGDRLSGGNVAIALLANTVATGAVLVALILTFGALSAHFNPAVTLIEVAAGRIDRTTAAWYIAAQCAGGLLGVAAAHVMFDLAVYSWSGHVRTGPSQWLSESIATFGLAIVIAGCGRHRPAAVPFAVGAYITSAYWFTASTSFANPAVTIARSISDTFAGIRAVDVAPFIAAQLVGAALAALVARQLFPEPAVR
jgi:glycerol uptake facilitator-like aquaporin